MKKWLIAAIAFPVMLVPEFACTTEIVDMGRRLELFVDDYMIQKLSGTATQLFHRPEPQEVVLVTDKSWEGNTCAYFSVFQDANCYRMYYRASNYEAPTTEHPYGSEIENGIAYAESKDGIYWNKPQLGLTEYKGLKRNNLFNVDGHANHNFSGTKNSNLKAPASAKYIGVGGIYGGLSLYTSSDALNWKKESVVTTNTPPFDSQNVVFWDNASSLYRCYIRLSKAAPYPQPKRFIRMSTSTDLKRWSEPVELTYSLGTPPEDLYTNAIQPYPRAPHILVGFPTRLLHQTGDPVEPVFMSSRNGLSFNRWPEAMIPRTAPRNRDGNRSNYMAWGFVELPGSPNDYSFYANENYYPCEGGVRVRRFTLRKDGFVSVNATDKVGVMATKPLRFTGEKLVINAKTAPTGHVSVEILNDQGQPWNGRALTECIAFTGDNIEHVVNWQNGSGLTELHGKTIQLRFELQEADLYSFRFR
jgi:hypothetical protein